MTMCIKMLLCAYFFTFSTGFFPLNLGLLFLYRVNTNKETTKDIKKDDKGETRGVEGPQCEPKTELGLSKEEIRHRNMLSSLFVIIGCIVFWGFLIIVARAV